ncbi:unnamed protein product [Lota lota]
MTTMRNTVLLLSLGLLLHYVSSNGPGSTDPGVTSNRSTAPPGVSPTDPGAALPGVSPTDPGATPPGVSPTDPGATPPGVSPTDPGATPPGVSPTVPGTAPPGVSPTDPGATPPGVSPTVPGTAPPGVSPTDPGATPPGVSPTDPGAAPTDPGVTSSDPGAHAPSAATTGKEGAIADTPSPAGPHSPPGGASNGFPESPKPTDPPSTITKVSAVAPQNPGPPKADEAVSTPSESSRTSGPSSGPVTVGPAATSLTPKGSSSQTPDIQYMTTQTPDQKTTGRKISDIKVKTFTFPMSEKHENEDQVMVDLCRRLMGGLTHGSCTLRWTQQDQDIRFEGANISTEVKDTMTNQYFDEIRKEKGPSKPGDKTTLIAILASCGALLAMIIGLGIYATHHRKPYHENQQHLTEELHTVENGYHDNPTLEVMEAQPEMQEKKAKLGNDFNDSWIVPMETMAKEVLPDEEDTHL